MYNRYKLKVTKFEGISQCISEVIVEKLRGGAKIAPPGLNRVKRTLFFLGVFFERVHTSTGAEI